MSIEITGSDFGVFVLARHLLRQHQALSIRMHIDPKTSPQTQETLYAPLMQKAIQETPFGRIGLFYERSNQIAAQWIEKNKTTFPYQPRTKRSQTHVCFTIQATPILLSMIHEGIHDSVEFRRLARKHIRPFKNAHCDTIVFFDSLFGDEKARSILSHIAGKQIRLLFPDDVFDPLVKSESKRNLSITSFEPLDFTQKRAESLLKTKLSPSSFS